MAKTAYGGTGNLFDPKGPATNDIGVPWPESYQYEWLTANDINDGRNPLANNADLDMFTIVDNRVVTEATINFRIFDVGSGRYVNNLAGGHFWISCQQIEC